MAWIFPRIEIGKELSGEPIVVGTRTIRPVARTSVCILDLRMRGGAITGVEVRILPREAVVREGDGTEYRIALTDPIAKMMRAMIRMALLAPLVYVFLHLLRREVFRR